MESSPLTQQTRPETFQPKIVQLYEKLLFESASRKPPVNEHALETLSTFLGGVLTKKYTNPSADIITILAGLHEVDQVFTEFVSVLDGIIRNGANLDLRLKAVDAAIAMTSGAYKTGLISYFMHRDLFPSLMKFVHDSDDPMQIFKPFLLLGLLANYNKFEFQNPYQLRLDDFVNETTILKIVRGVGTTCTILRNSYVAVQDDLPEGWTWSGTLAFFGLGALAGRSKIQPLTAEEMKERFAELHVISTILRLLTYVSANKIRLQYHWSELWRGLLTLTRFLTTYSADLSTDPNINILVTDSVNLLAFCISAGDTFLPDPVSYDDLFYKVVEAGPILSRFHDVYKHAFSAPAKTTNGKTNHDNKQFDAGKSLSTLLNVSTHFHSLLFLPEKSKESTTTDSVAPTARNSRKKNLNPREVHNIIKEGYATLSIEPREELSNWEKWREADWKTRLKRIARIAVDDARIVVTARLGNVQNQVLSSGSKDPSARGDP
ncbi:conserved hypothetical protein [Uncinocarpus reesii 1704]|uniref:Armadillo-like helical domain-containing protein n=1 Tax=Uncinocarpus reesii (strain UAMH 1704) TaxID=336963 RepID=C4JRN6_UNCRE|nr:uncharacterized protein UREG_05125 [Uncinocarpus reesii 1704]EEP80283.1 conserved hypothetical protein [Uncinocarpus reesii 1704]